MPDSVPELPVYARPPGENEVGKGVYVDDNSKITKNLTKMVKHFKPIRSIPKRKIKRFF